VSQRWMTQGSQSLETESPYHVVETVSPTSLLETVSPYQSLPESHQKKEAG